MNETYKIYRYDPATEEFELFTFSREKSVEDLIRICDEFSKKYGGYYTIEF